MAKTNSEVAAAFVAGGKTCSGSNTKYTVGLVYAGQSVAVMHRSFTSYSTVVAHIRDDILWWVDYRSQSTARQLSYIHSEWRKVDPEGKRKMCVDYPADGSGLANVNAYTQAAWKHLQDLLTPRIRPQTQARHWGQFLLRMELTDKLLTLPCYGLPMQEGLVSQRLATLRAIRASNDANPVGLGTVITNARAIFALEG